MKNTLNNYYVYRYVRTDLNIPFYIGKGKNNRYLDKNRRNPYFTNLINKVPFKVAIISSNLTEKEAFKKEKQLIILYKKMGYCKANIQIGNEIPGFVSLKEKPFRVEGIQYPYRTKFYENIDTVKISKITKNTTIKESFVSKKRKIRRKNPRCYF